MAAAVFGARSRAANLAAVTGMLGVAVAGAAVAVAAAGSPAVISVAVAAAAVAGAPSEAPPVRTLIGPGRSYRPMPLRGRRRDDPVPLMCWGNAEKQWSGDASNSVRTSVLTSP